MGANSKPHLSFHRNIIHTWPNCKYIFKKLRLVNTGCHPGGHDWDYNLVPYLQVKLLQLIWRFSTRTFHLCVSNLQMSCKDFYYMTGRQDSTSNNGCQGDMPHYMTEKVRQPCSVTDLLYDLVKWLHTAQSQLTRSWAACQHRLWVSLHLTGRTGRCIHRRSGRLTHAVRRERELWWIHEIRLMA